MSTSVCTLFFAVDIQFHIRYQSMKYRVCSRAKATRMYVIAVSAKILVVSLFFSEKKIIQLSESNGKLISLLRASRSDNDSA